MYHQAGCRDLVQLQPFSSARSTSRGETIQYMKQKKINEKSVGRLVLSQLAENSIAQSQLLTVMDHMDKDDFYDNVNQSFMLRLKSVV